MNVDLISRCFVLLGGSRSLGLDRSCIALPSVDFNGSNESKDSGHSAAQQPDVLCTADKYILSAIPTGAVIGAALGRDVCRGRTWRLGLDVFTAHAAPRRAHNMIAHRPRAVHDYPRICGRPSRVKLRLERRWLWEAISTGKDPKCSWAPVVTRDGQGIRGRSSACVAMQNARAGAWALSEARKVQEEDAKDERNEGYPWITSAEEYEYMSPSEGWSRHMPTLGSEQACLRTGKPVNLGERLGPNCQKWTMCSRVVFLVISAQIAMVYTDNLFITCPSIDSDAQM
ncbi:hypothetical protein B0H17DRAFT_1268393 [Mycena rosella]|uniref:Uncharacterized protein n=1 Tax=Mycena rosella TaxID=1033263 RepID=A0AAD7CM60_MYCRO|nr:hypothetical protein B0H17DRAFT_1268393 [Mycena rosella]